MSTFIPDPATTDWVPLFNVGTQLNPGAELAYAEITTEVGSITATTAATAQTIVTAPSITLDGATPVVIEFLCPYFYCSAIANVVWTLYDNGAFIGILGNCKCDAASSLYCIGKLDRRLAPPSAGAHVYSVRAYVSTGTGTIGAGAGGGAANYMPAFIRVSSVGPLIGSLQPPTYGTSLPASPVDGQEAVLVDSLSNPSYQWRFRWNAGSSSAYKWEFVGGSAASAYVAAINTFTSDGNWQDAGAGPVWVVPRTGEYTVGATCSMYNPSATGDANMGIAAGATAPVAPFDTNNGLPAVNKSVQLAVIPTGPFLGTAGIDIRMRYANNGGSAQVHRRNLYVIPRRVA